MTVILRQGELGRIASTNAHKRRTFGLSFLRENTEELAVPEALNKSWSIDFMTERPGCGRVFRHLIVLDEHHRRSLSIEVGFSLPAKRFIWSLNRNISAASFWNALNNLPSPSSISKRASRIRMRRWSALAERFNMNVWSNTLSNASTRHCNTQHKAYGHTTMNAPTWAWAEYHPPQQLQLAAKVLSIKPIKKGGGLPLLLKAAISTL